MSPTNQQVLHPGRRAGVWFIKKWPCARKIYISIFQPATLHLTSRSINIEEEISTPAKVYYVDAGPSERWIRTWPLISTYCQRAKLHRRALLHLAMRQGRSSAKITFLRVVLALPAKLIFIFKRLGTYCGHPDCISNSLWLDFIWNNLINFFSGIKFLTL